jgi:hypothetical protein
MAHVPALGAASIGRERVGCGIIVELGVGQSVRVRKSLDILSMKKCPASCPESSPERGLCTLFGLPLELRNLTSSVWLTATTCQSWYPLKSENASPSGTCTVYLSYAEMALPPKTASVIASAAPLPRPWPEHCAGRDRRRFGHNHSPRLV